MAGYASSMLGLDPANPQDEATMTDEQKAKKKKKKQQDQMLADQMSPFQAASNGLLNGAGNQY